MSTVPQGRILSQRFTTEVAEYMSDGGVHVSPQKEHDATGYKTGNLVGLDHWVIHTNRAYKLALSESVDAASEAAKKLSRPFSAVVQFRSAHDLDAQYVVMDLSVFTELVRRLEAA